MAALGGGGFVQPKPSGGIEGQSLGSSAGSLGAGGFTNRGSSMGSGLGGGGFMAPKPKPGFSGTSMVGAGLAGAGIGGLARAGAGGLAGSFGSRCTQ